VSMAVEEKSITIPAAVPESDVVFGHQVLEALVVQPLTELH
jgi:hypothetical protein